MRNVILPQQWKRQGFLPPKIAVQSVEQAHEVSDADSEASEAIEDFRRASPSYRQHQRSIRRGQ